MKKADTNGHAVKLAAGLPSFDQAMRALVKVPKAELEREERKYERRKATRKNRRQS